MNRRAFLITAIAGFAFAVGATNKRLVIGGVASEHVGQAIENLRVINPHGDGIVVTHGNAVIRNCHIYGCAGLGVMVLHDAPHALIENCTIEDCGTGIRFNQPFDAEKWRQFVARWNERHQL